MRILLFSVLLLPLTQTLIAQHPDKVLTLLPEKPDGPNFELSDTKGNTHRLSDYRGKVLIINFWATWCPPCLAEMPSMQRAWEKLEQEDIVMLAIDVGEDEDTISQFTADHSVDFPLLMDRDSTAVSKWPVRGLPTTFVVDPQGRLVYRAIGGREWDDPELMQQVRSLKE